MTASVDQNTIILTCKGAEFIRAQSVLVSLLGRKCKVGRGELRVPLMCADVVMEKFPNITCPELSSLRSALTAHGTAVANASIEFHNAQTDRISPSWRNVLDIPQQYAVNAMVYPGLLGACLFDEQGTGKTVMAIATFDTLVTTGEIDRLVVVSPKSMLGGWKKDVENFLKNKYTVGIIEGTLAQKRAVVDSCPDIIVVNYEGINNILVLLKALGKKSRLMLVMDESYYAKNPGAVRSIHLQELRPYCARGYVLCGTPAPRSPYDLINQVNLADDGYAFSSFSKGVSEDSDREIIKSTVAERAIVIRRLKQDVIKDVPEKEFKIIRIQLSDQQRLMYEKARDELLVELKTLDNRMFRKWLTTYFQRRATLLEICSTPKMVDPLYIKPSAKLIKLQELVRQLVSEGRKILIWTCYRTSVEEICSILSEYKPLVIDGTISSGEERARIVSDFQSNPNCMVLVANPAAAGAGITLHASHDAIYYSYTNQAAHYLQSLDRIHRRGQKARIVNYYMLICENTIEENEVRRLRQRELAQHDLLGDATPWPESLDQALAELD